MITDSGIETLKKLEGLTLVPTYDAKGRFSIGYGHNIFSGEEHLNKGIDADTAHRLLLDDAKKVFLELKPAVNVPLSPNQWDALIILGYNIGVNALKNSQLLKLINQKASLTDIYNRWTTRYVTSEGKVLEGLKKRRRIEADMFLKPTGGSLLLPLAAFIALIYAMKKI